MSHNTWIKRFERRGAFVCRPSHGIVSPATTHFSVSVIARRQPTKQSSPCCVRRFWIAALPLENLGVARNDGSLLSLRGSCRFFATLETCSAILPSVIARRQPTKQSRTGLLRRSLGSLLAMTDWGDGIASSPALYEEGWGLAMTALHLAARAVRHSFPLLLSSA